MAGFARRQLDVLGFARSGNEAAVQLFAIRDGKTVSRDVFLLENLGDGPDEEALSAFVKQYYATAGSMPPRVLVPLRLAGRGRARGVPARRAVAATWRSTCPSAARAGAHWRSPAGTPRRRWRREQARWLADQGKTLGALEELARRARACRPPPMRIECYDISTIQGTNTVGSMVVFEEGRPRSGEYRRFRIKTVAGTDDFASHREVLRRRFRRALESGGGERRGAALADARPGHHRRRQGPGERRARRARRAGPHDLPLAGLAKEREELFLPGRGDPIVLPATSQALYLVQRLRDEAHRFAITYHRKVRAQAQTRSALDDLPGVGPGAQAGAAAGVRHRPRRSRRRRVDEIAAVPGIARGAGGPRSGSTSTPERCTVAPVPAPLTGPAASGRRLCYRPADALGPSPPDRRGLRRCPRRQPHADPKAAAAGVRRDRTWASISWAGCAASTARRRPTTRPSRRRSSSRPGPSSRTASTRRAWRSPTSRPRVATASPSSCRAPRTRTQIRRPRRAPPAASTSCPCRRQFAQRHRSTASRCPPGMDHDAHLQRRPDRRRPVRHGPVRPASRDLELKGQGADLFDDYAADNVGQPLRHRARRHRDVRSGHRGTAASTAAPRSVAASPSDEMNSLVTVLKFGSLPLEIEEVGFSSLSATLGLGFLAQTRAGGPHRHRIRVRVHAHQLPAAGRHRVHRAACSTRSSTTPLFRTIPVTLTARGHRGASCSRWAWRWTPTSSSSSGPRRSCGRASRSPRPSRRASTGPGTRSSTPTCRRCMTAFILWYFGSVRGQGLRARAHHRRADLDVHGHHPQPADAPLGGPPAVGAQGVVLRRHGGGVRARGDPRRPGARGGGRGSARV